MNCNERFVMGNPLSPSPTKSFIDEMNIRRKNKKKDFPKNLQFFRYVDDIYKLGKQAIKSNLQKFF